MCVREQEKKRGAVRAEERAAKTFIPLIIRAQSV